MIPLSRPDITDLEIEAVVSVLKSSQLSLGPKLEEFENTFATYIGIPHAIGVSSGTAGLHLCLLALGVGIGEEVIVPSFTFIAAANAIRYVGATPVFIDIEPTTLNLDPTLIQQAITPRTRAIMVVHTFGYPADMTPIVAVARKHNLLVIEDACEAIGAEYGGVRVGSFGHAAVFAFYPNKQITTGEGGLIVTSDPALARTIKALRNQGRYDSDSWHQHTLVGYNYRLSEINAALGCAQMQRLEEILDTRERVAQDYQRFLGTNNDLVLPRPALDGERISRFVYVVRLPTHLRRAHRDQAIAAMRRERIQCGRYFAPIHTQPAYADIKVRWRLPVTESESERTIALPFFTRLSTSEIERVTQTLLATIDALL